MQVFDPASVYEPSKHPQRDADHESGHFVCLKLQAGERLQTFKISIAPGANWNAQLTFEHEELKDLPSGIMRLTCIAGIAAEAYGIHLDQVGKRSLGFSPEELEDKRDEIKAAMAELANDTGVSDFLYLSSLGPTPEGGWATQYDSTIKVVAAAWPLLHLISAAVLKHGTITNLNFTERVGLSL